MEANQEFLITTDLKGQVNNMPDSDLRKEALLPLFEAVINSIDAIEQNNSKDRGNIIIEIKRQQITLDGDESKSFIYGFSTLNLKG